MFSERTWVTVRLPFDSNLVKSFPDPVQASQSRHLHEGLQCSLPAGEDLPRARSADLLHARQTHKESVRLSRKWTGGSEVHFNVWQYI